MAQFLNMYSVDLQKPTGPQPLRQMVCAGDNAANRIGAIVTSDGGTVSLGGSCVGKVVRADGTTVQLSGTISGNQAYVVLDQASCAIVGQIQVAVCWVSGSNVTTLVIAYGSVVSTQTGSPVQPSTPIPDLTQLLTEIENMRTATAAATAAATGALANFAGAFSETAVYTAGQYVTYTDGKFYRLTADHAANVTWANTSKVAVTTGGELIGLKQAIATENANIMANFAGAFVQATAYPAGTYVTYTDGFMYVLPNGHEADVTWANTMKTQVSVGGELSELKSALSEIGVANETVDFSKYDVINGTIQSNGKWASITSSDFQSALVTDIPIKMKVKAKTDKNAYVSFFTKKPSQPSYGTSEIYFCEGETGRHTISMGTEETFVLPSDCKCIVVTVKSNALDYTPVINGIFTTGGILGELETNIATNTEDINELKAYVSDAEYTKAEAINKFTVVQTKLTHVWRGSSYESVQTQSIGSSLIEIPCNGYSKINYPVFMTSQDLGSIFLDENNLVIGGYANKTIATGGYATIDVPSNAVMFILNNSTSLNSYDWSVILFKPNIIEISEEIKELQNKPSVFVDENHNMCLAGIKTDILTNKIPYHRGFLFHKLQNNDGSLWYGTDFRSISKIGSVLFNPNSMRFAISPKDGRIIAVQRDTRNGIYVWDGETETHVTGFTLEPMAWLYNSGVEFINDGTDEYCIFAEYKGSTPYDSFNVWRGKYPYTSVSDWKIVLTQTPTDITHFHMVRRDPWTDILYLTSGDDSAKCKWWYSTDKGATWTLLTTGSTSGYEEHICRCINFIFTADYIYWATDKGTNHCLNRVERDSDGVIDVSSREKLCDLPASIATNSICYVESPHGIFMYDRIDIGYTADYGKPVPMSFWDIDKAELTTPFIIPLTVSDWGGSRGKCYVNYTNGKQPMPAMGFSLDTPCVFDLVCDTPARIGTIAYEVGSKTIHTVNY